MSSCRLERAGRDRRAWTLGVTVVLAVAPWGLAVHARPARSATSAGLDAQASDALSSFLTDRVSGGDVPGVVVLVTTADRILYHEAFGLMDAGHGWPMRKDTIFRIASMTKPLTSTGVLMLVEEGKVGLDEPVATYLPAFKSPQVVSRVDLAAGTYQTRPATRPITIRQLLTHTSGIGYSWSDPRLALIEKVTGRTSEVDLPLLHEPGEAWTYGASTKVLGDVIAKVSGQPLEVFLGHRIFQPLGMRDTGWTVPLDKQARVATLHQRTNGRLVETPNPPVLTVPARGDGRLFSTAADYGRFVQMMLGEGRSGAERLLEKDTVREMGRNQTGNVRVRIQPVANPAYSEPYPTGAGQDVWGLGFQVAQPAKPTPDARRPGSLSWAGINNTFFWIDPQAGIGCVVLMQLLPFYDDAAMAVLRGVETRVYQHLAPGGSRQRNAGA
jgi:CubicO group peptidase (beta-lactamase class C family)